MASPTAFESFAQRLQKLGVHLFLRHAGAAAQSRHRVSDRARDRRVRTRLMCAWHSLQGDECLEVLPKRADVCVFELFDSQASHAAPALPIHPRSRMQIAPADAVRRTVDCGHCSGFH